MKSGLEGRNNRRQRLLRVSSSLVSMKSGLEGRNNTRDQVNLPGPRIVSMKSGLEGRNNLRFMQEVIERRWSQ